MAMTDPIVDPVRRSAHRAWSTIAAMLWAALVAGCSATPQMGPDREVFSTIDALFTAVSLREPSRVDRCAETLETLHDEGKLPGAAFEALEAIIDRAEDGDWESSQADLRRFMLAQRR